MAKQRWIAFPHDTQSFAYDGEALKRAWTKLHKGDGEAFPKDAKAQDAWRRFHRGDFESAVASGVAAGGGGITAANKAQAIYANGVETREASRIALFEEVMKRAETQL